MTTYKDLHKELQEYTELEDNWGGYTDKRPTEEIISTVSKALHALEKNHFKVPRIMLSAITGIGLFWKKDRMYFELGFDIDNKFSYLEMLNKDYTGKDDVPLTDLAEILNEYDFIKETKW